MITPSPLQIYDDNLVGIALIKNKILSEAMFECEQCWSSPQTGSSILPHKPAIPWRPNSHVQDYPWSPGIPHGVQLHTSNPQRSTQPRLQVPPTAMMYAPSPIRLHDSGCPILEQIAGWDILRILGEIFRDTPGCPLAVLVPRSTHLAHLLSQPIPSAHIDPCKKLTSKWSFPYTPNII